MIPRSIGYALLGLLSLLGIVPILSMLHSTVYDTHGFSLHAYTQLLQDSALWISFAHSVGLAFTVSSMTTVVGVLLGLLLSKTNLYARTFWLILLLIPLLIPPYITAYGWYGLIGRESMLGHLLFGFVGTAWVLFTVYLAIPTLLTALFLRQINPRLEEMGLLYGSWREILRTITLPLTQPAMVFSFLLVFILSISELSVANFLRFDVFALHSFTQFSAFYDFKMATIYTMPLLFIVLSIIFLAYILPKKTLHFQSYHNILTIDVSNYQWLYTVLMIVLSSVLVGLPLFGLFSQSTVPAFSTALTQGLPAIIQSLFYASTSAMILLFLGFITASIIVYKSIKAWQWLQGLLLFFFVLSSILLGIGLILFWNRPSTNIIYSTSLIVFIAYTLKYLFLSTAIIQLRLKQIPTSLIEAAQLLRASNSQILRTIILPLSKEALIIASLVGFIFTLRETTLTMLVAPAGTSTLPIYIMTQMANGDEHIIASLCLIMILMVVLPLFGMLYYLQHKGDKDD